MKPQLQDRIYFPTGFTLQDSEFIQIGGIEHQWLFTNRIGVGAQRKTHMGIVKVVRRTDGHVINTRTAPAKRIDVAVKLLEFRKEFRIGKMAVDDTDRIIGIEGCQKSTIAILDRPHVTRGNVAGGSDQSKSSGTHQIFRLGYLG